MRFRGNASGQPYPHNGCPNGSLRPYYRQGPVGDTRPAYVRVQGEALPKKKAWERERHKRAWKRVGTVCIDCGAFVFGDGEIPEGPTAGDIASGIPTAAASSDGSIRP